MTAQMRVNDEALWIQQKEELSVDDTGKAFLLFLQDWLTTADRAMDLSPELTPVQAFRDALVVVEQRQGRIACSFIGQMLVVAISHWVHGEELTNSLTSVERRLMEDTVLIKLAELEASAAQDPEKPTLLVEEETPDEEPVEVQQ